MAFKYAYQLSLFVITSTLLSTCSAQWIATFNPANITMESNTLESIQLILSNVHPDIGNILNDREKVRLVPQNERVVLIDNPNDILFVEEPAGSGTWITTFQIYGVFIGGTTVNVVIRDERSSQGLNVIVLRPDRLIDSLFSVAIVFLLAILFVNFGAAIDLKIMKEIYRRPIAPAIGTFCQLVFMPLIAYSLGLWLFPNEPELALGLFMCGITPAGGASNIWALLLGGNINLSLSMTTISTLAAFGTMPLWLFMLGTRIFYRANLGVPYLRVTLVAMSLLLPMAGGLLIQKIWPKVGKFLVKILKPLSLIFIILIVILGLFTNLYMLQMFAWEIAMAGLGLPWFGMIIGGIAALIFRQTKADTVAIAIETGVQNTGMTMFLMTFSFEQPAADITMIIPIAVSILTPIPLLIIIAVRKCIHVRRAKKAKNSIKEPLDTPTNENTETTETTQPTENTITHL